MSIVKDCLRNVQCTQSKFLCYLDGIPYQQQVKIELTVYDHIAYAA